MKCDRRCSVCPPDGCADICLRSEKEFLGRLLLKVQNGAEVEPKAQIGAFDPEVLVEPWVLHPRILQLTNNPMIIAERGSCTDTELEEVSTQIRH